MATINHLRVPSLLGGAYLQQFSPFEPSPFSEQSLLLFRFWTFQKSSNDFHLKVSYEIRNFKINVIWFTKHSSHLFLGSNIKKVSATTLCVFFLYRELRYQMLEIKPMLKCVIQVLKYSFCNESNNSFVLTGFFVTGNRL